MVKSTPFAAAAASLLLLPSTLAEGMYSKSSSVLQVDHRSYDSLIAKSNHTSIVEFYAPWCGHCQNLKPAYEKAAKSLTGLAKVAAIDCDEESNKQFCGSMGVQGFPTLKIVRPSKKPGRPTVEDYQGARTAKGIVDAVVEKIPNHVKRLQDSNYEEWLEKGDEPKAILFSDKGTVSALLKSLAIDFLGAISVAQVRDKEKEVVEVFSIDSFPTLVLVPGEGKDPITYNGEMKKKPMLEFLSTVASPNPDPAPTSKKAKPTSSNKSKASKASSSFSKSSASQASEQAQTDAASQTLETLEDEPTESPSPEVDAEKPIRVPTGAKPIVSLVDSVSLQQKCLNDKAGTCILALIPEEASPSAKTTTALNSLSEIHHKHSSGGRNLFPFYQIPASNPEAAALRSQLELSPSDAELIAVNGKRSWWRYYPGAGFEYKKVEDWIDEIRMGDSPKLDLPKSLVVVAADLPPESPVEEDPSFTKMKENLKNQVPEGMDFVLEEITDDDYTKLMEDAEEAAKESEAAHDEL